MAQKAIARRPFDYAGKALDRGQVFELAGSRNDEKLLRLRYVEEWKGKDKDLHECAACRRAIDSLSSLRRSNCTCGWSDGEGEELVVMGES
jgi:hypothetical protein